MAMFNRYVKLPEGNSAKAVAIEARIEAVSYTIPLMFSLVLLPNCNPFLVQHATGAIMRIKQPATPGGSGGFLLSGFASES